MEFAGGCYCGAVRYRATQEPLYQTTCHCDNCRRAAGAQAVAFITVPAKSFAFTTGEPTAFRTDTAATRTFCGRCGTSLTYVGDNRSQEVDIHTATLADPEAFPPTRDVFPEEKLSWVALSAPAPLS